MKANVEVIERPAGARTIGRALGVLDCFSTAASSLRTTSIAQRCGLPVPTTHRILRVLERYGYLVRDPASAEYSLGPAAASLAHEDPFVAALRRAAPPALRTLCSAAGERAVLAGLSGSRDHAIEISIGQGDRSVTCGDIAHPAVTRPLHAGASAKVLLAELANDELDRLLARRLDRIGPATITRPTRLRGEVNAIRRRGWAFSREETAANSWALAVPVRRPRETALAVGISAPLERFDRARAARHLALLEGVARRITGALHAEVDPVAAAGAAA
ncbi:MAG TPA: IclR family transcriptional regulator C-terminal domain-containing protein [Solirubrobacterales bacterium]|nr:IclR family transcriptional regulator C-terminal domain-containing protein [Solirubrobacterales bacterium]